MLPGKRSTTSTWVSAVRALYTSAPAGLQVVDDYAALSLLPLKLSAPLRAVSALPLAPRCAHRMLGFTTLGLSYDVALRTAAIDDVVRTATERGVRQLVLLGAGLDTRAWRMPELEHTTVYELDYPSTQAYKRPRIEAITPLAKELRYGALDFEKHDLHRVLPGLDFDRHAPSVWIAEGVLQFLTRAAVDAILDGVARCSTAGSVFCATYVPPAYGATAARAASQWVARIVGEPLKTTLLPHELRDALGRRGFTVDSDDTAKEWARRFWPDREARRVRSWERLIVASQPEHAPSSA